MEKTEMNNKEEQKRKNTICFIQVAQEMLDEENFRDISIRKIAQRSGFHNSTIYLYFKDFNELIMLASMKYFWKYSYMLELQSQKKLSPSENFISIWELFFDTVLGKPDIFYNFFFGKHKFELDEIMNSYYEIFPGERRKLSGSIEAMYFGENIMERSLHLMRDLIGENNLVTAENIDMLNEITVSYCKYKLEEKCQNPDLDPGKIKEDFLWGISYITGVSIQR